MNALFAVLRALRALPLFIVCAVPVVVIIAVVGVAKVVVGGFITQSSLANFVVLSLFFWIVISVTK